MAFSLSPRHLKRYKDIAALFFKYGHGDLLKDGPVIDDPLPNAPTPPIPPKAEELARDLEKLGPTFVKLGQLLSTRADFLPVAYMEALSRLQDHVEPFPFEQVEAIVSVEVGARISKAFQFFDDKPLAAASLGQVHRAVLRSGQEVVVKVQRPNVRDLVAEDLDAMGEIAALLEERTETGRKFQFVQIIEELRKSLLRELDYRLEALNLKFMREKLAEFPRIMVPAPVDDYSTGRVLTMEYITGQKITKINPLARIEIDGPGLAEELFQAYLHQILVAGTYHADPHPGNVFLTQDHRVALLDLGMVAHMGPQMQEQLLRLLLAISEGQSDQAAELAAKMAVEREDSDPQAFHTRMADLVSQQQTAAIEDMQAGKALMQIARIAGETGLNVPPELTMLGKTLLNLDLVGRTLSPGFNPNESIRRNASRILRDRTLKSFSPGNLFTVLLDTKEFVERLPARLNQLLDLVSSNKLKVKVDTIDEHLIVAGMQKIANRITMGLILASLIVGASMLMRVETSFRVWGYPGFAILFFLAASAGGIALVIQILRSDEHGKK